MIRSGLHDKVWKCDPTHGALYRFEGNDLACYYSAEPVGNDLACHYSAEPVGNEQERYGVKYEHKNGVESDSSRSVHGPQLNSQLQHRA